MSKRLTTAEFIARARKVHGDKYDYSKTDLYKRDEKGRICIICHNKDKNGNEHGEFWQLPSNHLNGQKCKKCKYEKISTNFSMKNEEFIFRASLVHNNKYDYSKVDLEHKDEKGRICIICPIHGEFWQRPAYHLSGGGCERCGVESAHLKQSYNTDIFISLAKQIHGDEYDYSKVKYIDSDTNVCIICPKHGEFWQRPADHLQGRGCNKCKESYLEKEVRKLFKNKKIEYIQQCSRKKFSWLNRQSLDFYLPNYNVAIECQGIQHYKVIEHFGGAERLKYTQQLDKRKKNLCEEHGVKLYYINYNEDVETKLSKILKEICLNT